VRVHIITDRFSTGGGIEHIFQLVCRMQTVRFEIYAGPGEAEKKFRGLNNVSVKSGSYAKAAKESPPPDLLHFHHLKPLFCYLFLRKRLPVPVLYTAHGLHARKYQFKRGWRYCIAGSLRRAVERLLFRRLDQIIAVSRADRECLIQSYSMNPDRVTYIPNGIQPPARSPDPAFREQFRIRWGLPKEAVAFVTVARFHFQKGYDILLPSIRAVASGNPRRPFGFFLVGDGEEFIPIQNLAEELGISPWIRFLGRREDVPRLLTAGDVFVLPSRWEGLPIGIIEAGFAGLPVIASDTCGNRELIEDGRGILFENLNSRDLAEKIRGVLDNRYPLKELAERLHREITRRYSIDRMAVAIQKVYRRYAP